MTSPPNTNDLLTTWSTLALDEIAARLESGQDAAAAEQLFGAETAAELVATAPVPATRGPLGERERVVLLPGIMGSLLASIRGITTSLWINPTIFLEGHANYLELDETGATDANPAIEAVPVGIERLVYLKIALALRREAELYEFPYDWRRPIEYNAEALHRSLARWGQRDPGRQFTLVGHSMGGIVARAYLARHPDAARDRVKRVISLGTPYFGAANAIQNVVLGNDMLVLSEKLNAGNRANQLLMSLPSFYQLLPPPPDLFPAGRGYPANWDLYDPDAWRWQGLRPGFIRQAREFHRLLAGAGHPVETIQIAGCNLSTTVEIRREFDAHDRAKFDTVSREEGPDAGDGTVPLWSATLPGAQMYYVQEKHRDLPGNSQVIDAMLALLRGDAPQLAVAIPPRRPGIFSRDVLTPPDLDTEAAVLRERLRSGTATEEDLAKLFFLQ